MRQQLIWLRMGSWCKDVNLAKGSCHNHDEGISVRVKAKVGIMVEGYQRRPKLRL